MIFYDGHISIEEIFGFIILVWYAILGWRAKTVEDRRFNFMMSFFGWVIMDIGRVLSLLQP